MLCSDLFDGAGHIALDVDQDFKEGSYVVFEVTAEYIVYKLLKLYIMRLILQDLVH